MRHITDPITRLYGRPSPEVVTYLIEVEPDADVSLVDGVQYASATGSSRNVAMERAAYQTLAQLDPQYVRQLLG
jgi:hypothetical protein